MATIAYVTGQATALGANGGTTAALDTTGCKLLVVSAGFWAGGAGPETFSDSAGNSWTEIHDQSFSNTGLQWYYCLAPTTSAAHTFTYTSANSYTILHVLGYSATIGFTYDQKATNQGNVATIQPGSLTPAQPDSLLIANQCFDVASAQAIDSSFTERYDSILVPGTNMGLQSSDLILPAPAATNPTMSGGGAVDRTAAMAVFYETPFSYTEREPLVIEDGVIEQLQSDSKLTDVVYADAASLTPDNAVVRVDGTRKEVQTSTALLADTGALTLAQNASLETSGAHLPIFTFTDSAGNPSWDMRALLATSYSIGIGIGCLQDLTTGQYNFCLGYHAGFAITEGNSNICIGNGAGQAGTTMNNNTLVGVNCGRSLTLLTGSQNSAYGLGSLQTATTAVYNTASGYNSLYGLTQGGYNVGLGGQAGRTITTGSQNVFVGYGSGYHASQLATPTNSIGIGYGVYTTASNQVVIGNSSIAETLLQSEVRVQQKATEETSGAHTPALTIYDSAGEEVFAVGAHTLVSENFCMGPNAGTAISSGQYNTCIGINAGQVLNTGGSNFFLGKDAGQNMTSGGNNVGIGRGALDNTDDANYNVAIGSFACNANVNDANVAIGYASMLVATGSANMCLGQNAGRTLSTGSNNIFIGDAAGHTGQLGTATESIVIGKSLVSTADYQIKIGTANHLTTEIAGGNIVLNCFDTNSIATATRSAILGGYSNTISQTAVGCCIPFGYSNNISGGWGHSFCYAGGYNCHITATTATSDYSAILSGTSNAVTSSTVSTIAGGSTNTITGASNYSAIGGGTLNDIADSLYATVCGGGNNNITATTDSSSIVGGNANNITASSYAFIGGGLQNGIISASNYSTVAGGRSNSISASVYATIGGGYDNDITGSVNATILGGGSNNISGSAGYSIAGGRENNITAAYAVATGYQGEAINMGQRSHAVGYFAADGDAQHTDLVMRRQTTDATPRASLIDGASTSVVMPDNTAWTIHALTVAQLSDGSEAAAYEHKALINKDGAANPAVVGSVTKTVIAESTAAWDCSLSVSGANPRMVYTGENAHTINWVTTWRIAQVSVAS